MDHTKSLGMGLFVALLLLILPVSWLQPIKNMAMPLLRPGQLAALRIRQETSHGIHYAKSLFQTTSEVAATRAKLQRLQKENQQLLRSLTAIGHSPKVLGESSLHADGGHLLEVRSIQARVLGQEARAFLQRHQLLDVGLELGIEQESLVVDGAMAWIDQGAESGIQPEYIALSQGSVWGKIAEVGLYASFVHTVVEPGYRDLVRIVPPKRNATEAEHCPRGILEGTGEPLARIRQVEVTEPVAVGDFVYTAAGRGLGRKPLLYGQVVRVERAAGSAHWDIWMKPAVVPDEVEHAIVLQVELNPLRIDPNRRRSLSK